MKNLHKRTLWIPDYDMTLESESYWSAIDVAQDWADELLSGGDVDPNEFDGVEMRVTHEDGSVSKFKMHVEWDPSSFAEEIK